MVRVKNTVNWAQIKKLEFGPDPPYWHQENLRKIPKPEEGGIMEVKQRKSSKKGEVVPDAAEEEAKGEEEPTGFDIVEVTGDLDDRLS